MKKLAKHVLAEPDSIDFLSLIGFVERFSEKRVVVLGDFVVDEYKAGEISLVSSGAPVLILHRSKSQVFPGGGANAVNNLLDLGAYVLPVSAVGDDMAGEALIKHFRSKGVNVSGIVRVAGWTTPVKTRFLAGWAQTIRQQILRVDREPDSSPPGSILKKLQRVLGEFLHSADAFVVCDYGFGVACPEVTEKVAVSRKQNLIWTLDARHSLGAYGGLGITSATPSETELEALHHTAIGDNLDALERCGRATLTALNLSALLVTRGCNGMALFEPGTPTTHLAICGSDQAVDVTGAGDTVLAAYTLALSSGASFVEAAHIANLAGGLVVAKPGTATVRREELLATLWYEARVRQT